MSQLEGRDTASSIAAANRERRLAECYQRGVRLGTREKNYEYAHAMFAECVVHDPSNLQFVEALIQNLRSRTPHAKKSWYQSLRRNDVPLQKALQRKNWTQAFRLGMDLLHADPWDAAVLRTLANACAALHLNEVELVYLKQALDGEPKNVDVNRHCARSLGRMGQFDQAIACWHRVETLRGKDAEATRMILELAQEKLKYPGGRPPVARAQHVPSPIPESESSPEVAALSPQHLLEQAIAQDPKNVANYLELAALLLSNNRFAYAEALLTRAITTCGENPTLADRLQQVRELQAKQRCETADERESGEGANQGLIHVSWLELSLVVAGLLLAVQVVPSVRAMAWNIIDIPHWSQFGWIVFNLFLILGLVAIRFWAELRAAFRPSRARRRRRTSA
jgi:tetratricopeptide (TPR) repeat protein